MSDRTERNRFVQRVQQVAEQLRDQGVNWFQDLLPVDRLDQLLQELGIVFRERGNSRSNLRRANGVRS